MPANVDTESGPDAMTNPEAIEAATEWIGTKVQGAADIVPAALVLAVLYRWKKELMEAPRART